MKKLVIYLLCFGSFGALPVSLAGNDVKRGQAGATELLVNTWSKSSGMANSNTAGVRGAEAMMFNMGGLVRSNSTTEFNISNTRYLVGSGIQAYTLGFAQKTSSTGALGISLVAWNLGDFIETTTDRPEGTGTIINPQFFNLSVGYSKIFSNSISGGILLKVISHSIPDASSQGVAFDAGIQYKTGANDRFKFGVSARNLGPRLRYNGEGFSFRGQRDNIGMTIQNRSAAYEMPAQLHIGTSYDFLPAAKNRITIAGNFTSNSYTHDNIQVGTEYSFNEVFMLRGGFNYQKDVFSSAEHTDAHTGPSFGASVQVPLGGNRASLDDESQTSDQPEANTNAKKSSKLGIDYSYRMSSPFGGTHNLGIVLSF